MTADPLAIGAQAFDTYSQGLDTIARNLGNMGVPGSKETQFTIETDNDGLLSMSESKNYKDGSVRTSDDPFDFSIFAEVPENEAYGVKVNDGQAIATKWHLSVNPTSRELYINEHKVDGVAPLEGTGQLYVDQAGRVFEGDQPRGQLQVAKITGTDPNVEANGSFIPGDNNVIEDLATYTVSQRQAMMSNVTPTTQMIEMMRLQQAAHQAVNTVMNTYNNDILNPLIQSIN